MAIPERIIHERMQKVDQQQRMILKNQWVIMVALIAQLPKGHAVTGDLYYHSAKTHAYLGPEEH